MRCSIDTRTRVLYNSGMHTQIVPDTITKLTLIGDAAKFEPAGDQPQGEQEGRPYQSHSLSECITNVVTPTGHKPVLKTLMTTACEKNCFYCPFRAGRSKTKRLTFSPDELAKGFHTLESAGQVDGLFLSSGVIRGGVTTQDRIIQTAEIIRSRYNYRGYLHLKIMPGAEYEQLYRIMQLADRVSINLEGPTQERLDLLAPKKDFQQELLTRLQWAAEIRRAHPDEKLAGTVTQFVVGAVGDTDTELLSLSQRLYREMGLTRAYYSGFSPILQTPFENLSATDPIRERRLYQASFLLRSYNWDVRDLPFTEHGNLQTGVDPKRAWAEQHLLQAPIEIMTASREQLLRLPGIGPIGADAIIQARKKGRLREISQLRKLGIREPERAIPFVLLGGRRPVAQQSLF